MDHNKVIDATVQWLQEFVIGQNLCPFANNVLSNNTIRYTVNLQQSEEALLHDLCSEILHLQAHPEMATTLLIHPNALNDFAYYNQFLDAVDGVLEEMKCVDEFQVASFHPDYQFAGTEIGDADNFTNRSPYPMLHILRESLVTDAIDHYPDIDQIPDDNIQRVRRIGSAQLHAQLLALQGR